MNKEELKARALAIKAEVGTEISEKQAERLDEAGIEGNSMPLSGLFGAYKTAGEKKVVDGKEQDFRHLRMVTKSDDGKVHGSVSLSNIRIVGLIGKAKPEFGKITKKGTLENKAYLKGKALNPKFAEYSGFELIALLENRKFTAVETTVRTLPYKETGHELADCEAGNVELDSKKAYVITLLD